MEQSFQNESPTEFILIEPPELPRKEIEHLVGTRINNIDLYQRAFTHKSALKRYTLTQSFETMEFMGDSVLGFVITKMLFDEYENYQEGFLTKARTKLVRGNTLADIAMKLELHKWILMDEKGIRHGWNRNEKILEDVFESFIGAIYLDLGMVHAKKFILNIFQNPEFVNMDYLMVDDNYKDQLMRYCQLNKFELPQYNVHSQNNGEFVIHVVVNGKNVSSGQAKIKKYAEQDAAKNALKHLNQI
jgi:ribonuclease-3